MPGNLRTRVLTHYEWILVLQLLFNVFLIKIPSGILWVERESLNF
jgi:hypothetical protein